MGVILFTGAGFSRNWGGWLASEAFEYLLGCDGLHPRARTMLWNHKDKGGFEGVYQSLKDGATNSTDRDVFQSFDAMVTGMFHTMGYGFRHALLAPSILKFLATFDAIFTLNQDTLLELKYPGDEEIRERSQGKFLGWECPGIQSVGDRIAPPGSYTAQNGPFVLPPRKQPYIKLHGSSNWMQQGAPWNLMLIIGGNKAAEIEKQPLLKWYHEKFQEMLTGSQVVIIGYSFNDEHINQRLCHAVTQGARLFIIDPSGTDIIDKRPKGPGMIPIPTTPLMEALMGGIDGASRRPLITTFSGDEIEREKIYHFITKSSRQAAS